MYGYDVARPYTAATAFDPHLTFLFFDQNYQTSGDLADGCLLSLYAPLLPRASWAGAAQPYLFGWEIDPADRAAYHVSNCDAHFGAGAADALFDDIVGTGRWGVGLLVDIDPAVVQALYAAFFDPADYLGAAITTTSNVVPVPSWEGYSAATVVDAAWDMSPGGAAPTTMPGASAVRDRSSPSIPTLQTPVHARYYVSSTTLWVFR